MVRVAVIACLFFLPAAANPADVIPPHVVGVWATKNAVLRGEALFEGQGLYLDTDGIGAVIGGPPPIGVRIVATYDSATNAVTFEMTEHGKAVGTGAFTYDPSRKVIVGDRGIELHRRFDRISSQTRKALGLEPKSQ